MSSFVPHGTTIYLAPVLLVEPGDATEGGDSWLHFKETLWHEIFHCLTRNNPDFRADMYKLIHFTMHDTDFVLPPSVEVLEQRLRSRGTDSEEAIAKRLARSAEELKQAPQFDVAIVNDDLQRAVEETRQKIEEFLSE